MDVEVFESTDISMLRYQRDYPKIVKNKQDLSKTASRDGGGAITDHDLLLNDVVVYFKQNGEVDSFMREVIGGQVSYGTVGLTSDGQQQIRR